MSAKYKVAIIGAGMISNAAHIPAYKNLKDRVEIVAVSDPREEAANATAARADIPRRYMDPYKMLVETEPDIVSICTPNALHKDLALAAFNAGAHVLCEKPLSTSYRDTVEMFHAAKKAGKHLAACQTLRYGSENQAVKRLIGQGELGEIYFANITHIRRRGVPQWGMFHIKEKNAGGVFCDLGVHMVDSLLWLCGNPKLEAISTKSFTMLSNRKDYVSGTSADSGAESGQFTPREYDYREFNVEEFATGSMRFENNLFVNFSFSWALNLPNVRKFEIAGTKSGIILPEMDIFSTLGPYQSDTRLIVNPNQYESLDFSGHYSLIEHFVNVIGGREALSITPEESINVAAVIDGFYKSAELNREVTYGEIIKE